MTAQMSDVVMIGDEALVLVGVEGRPVFEPESFGIEPLALSSACWRGTICMYQIAANQLTLSKLLLSSRAIVNGVPVKELPSWQDRRPEPAEESWHRGNYRYVDLSVPIPLTGGLLVAGGEFLERRYMNMGFSPGWVYEKVLDLRFSAGRLQSSRDRSQEAARIRQSIAEGTLADPDGQRGQPGWVERRFQLAYDRTFPPGRAEPSS